MSSVRIRQGFDADVIVAGAGPAGASAAAHLSRRGHSVLLLDQRRFPRDKVCGDFVGPVALKELEALGVTRHQEFRSSNCIRSAALHVDGVNLVTQPIPAVPGLPDHGVVIPRKVLDRLVLEAAVSEGAALLQGAKLTRYSTDQEGVTAVLRTEEGEKRYRGRVLFGADGSGSTTGRLMRGSPTPSKDRIIAVRAYYSGVSGPPDRAELYFTGDSFPGYYWLFPTGSGSANVGVGMVQDTVPPTEDHLRDLLGRLVRSDPALRGRLGHARLEGKIVGWPLVTYNPRLPIVADRVVLLGDAAGLINSLNGEGIQYALLSGRWAAEVFEECLPGRRFDARSLRRYSDRVADELRLDMALSSMIVQLIRNRSLNPLWLHALRIIAARARRDPEYAALTGGVLAGLVPASAVMSPKVVVGTATQAAFTEASTILFDLLRGPAHCRRRIGELSRTTAGMATSSLAHPLKLGTWAVGVAACAGELATQVLRQQMKQRRPILAKRPSGAALKIRAASHPHRPPQSSRSIM